jgi:hypothetical protein
MGYDLSGGFSLNIWEWRYCLSLAQAFGWKPEGTEAPNFIFTDADGKECQFTIPSERWSGTYFSNDFQWVRASDAHGLFVALDRALALFQYGAGDLTAEQADALEGLPEDHVPWLKEVACYFADRSAKGGFAIY